MSDVIVRELVAEEMPEAGALLGRSLRDTPSSIQVAGADPAGRETVLAGLLGAMLGQRSRLGTVLGAFRAGKLAGVCAFAPPGRGQPTLVEGLAMSATVLRTMPLGSQLKIQRWLDGWVRHELGAKPHWRLGPVGVERELWRQGIGRALLTEFCARVDAQDGVASLEIDQDEHKVFFQKFAFRVDAGAKAANGPARTMRRAAGSDTARWARTPESKPYVLGRPVAKG